MSKYFNSDGDLTFADLKLLSFIMVIEMAFYVKIFQ